MLALTGFHNWFKSPIHKWLQIVHDRSCDRICKAVETDKVILITPPPYWLCTVQIKGHLEGGGATKGQKLDSCCLCGRVSSAVGARSAGEAQLLRGGSDRLLRPGTQDLAPAGLARLCGGLHLHHPADRRKRRGRRTRARLPRVGIGSHLYLWRSQNFCSEAVCYSEMMTRKIERNQLGRDYKSFTVQVKPRARQRGGLNDDVGSKCQQVFSLATQRAQRCLCSGVVGGALSCQSFTVAPPIPPLLCSPASFPSLCLHLHPLSLLFFSSLLSASSASP